jgi:GNAT superfamily N-acetyltransferase
MGTGQAITVRLARPEDWPAVAALLVELGRGVAEGTADDPTHHLAFAGHIRQIEHVTLVALDGEGSLVGVIDTEYHQRLGDHRPQARVNDLVVAQAARGAGVGTALLSRAEDLARKRGCFRMALVTAAWRAEAIAFYEREGWANYGEWFVKSLVDDVGPGGEPAHRDDT